MFGSWKRKKMRFGQHSVLFFFLGVLFLTPQSAQEKTSEPPSKSSLEAEAWFSQILLRLQSSDLQVVSSAQEALYAYGPQILSRLHPYLHHPQIATTFHLLEKRFTHPDLYFLQEALTHTQGVSHEILQKLQEPFTYTYQYQEEPFLERTIEVFPFEGEPAFLGRLLQNEWIHQLDESGYFQVEESALASATTTTTPVHLQLGGHFDWIFLQGNARLVIRLWLKQKEGETYRLYEEQESTQILQGKHEWLTAWSLVRSQVQAWLPRYLPQEKTVLLEFSPPQNEWEWMGLKLLKQHHFPEALCLLQKVETQHLNYALALEISGNSNEAFSVLQRLTTPSAQKDSALDRLKKKLSLKKKAEETR
jgi:hypothetical protein